MCGLAGIFADHRDLDLLQRRAIAMQSRLRHRGPDDAGIAVIGQGNGIFVHSRLSILDLSEAGHQPMTSADHRFTIVFNGEIYNYQSLRLELEQEGIDFRSKTDTEVLLALYQREGSACLDRLEGMFAFAIWDSLKQVCFFARDPLGIKPLYLWHHHNQLAFASELRAILEANLGTRRISREGLAGYLLFGSVQEPATLVDGIKMLPAGHFATWSLPNGNHPPSVRQYWDIDWSVSDTQEVRSSEDAVAHTREMLEDSIRRHFVSDVPVGVFLSGGCDSTAVVALARSVGQRNLQTFCIGFEETEFDESQLAARTAREFQTDHHTWMMNDRDGLAVVAEFLEHLDQPSNDGFNTFCISKFAREHGMKVVLSGLGGDELFAGYPSFDRVPQLVRIGDWMGKTGLLRRAFSRIGQNSRVPSKVQRIAAYLDLPPGYPAAYWTSRSFFSTREVSRLVRSYTETEMDSGIAQLLDWPIPRNLCEGDTISYLEMTRYMRNQLLRDSDVMSMANGLELRVPWVDRKLVDSLREVPPHLRHASGKRLLIDAVPEIPDWISQQSKKGFRFPFDRWIGSHWGALFSSIDAWSPVPLNRWYRRWVLFTLHHFLRENRVDVATPLP